MSHAKTADYANSAHWDTIIGKPNFADPVDDISELKAAGFGRNDIPVWYGKKFIPVNRSSLVDTTTFFSSTNLPYTVHAITWNPGTLGPLKPINQTFDLSGLEAGFPVSVGVPSILEGAIISVECDATLLTLNLWNPTPYDIVFTEIEFNVILMK